MEAFAHENIAVAAVAIGFTEGTFAPASTVPATGAFVTCEGASCRYRFDGIDPTAVTGHLLQVGDSIDLVGAQNLYNFKAIRDTGVSATLRVTYLH
jgi:hypothetical protein